MEGLTKITTDGIPDTVELIPYSKLEERGKQYEGTLFIYTYIFSQIYTSSDCKKNMMTLKMIMGSKL